MSETSQFVRVDYHRFKAFNHFSLNLRHFNILVGPNNAGKSTILASFRILAAALRKAFARNPQVVRGPLGDTLGYIVDLNGVSVAAENIYYNYDDSEPASVKFKLSNGGALTLYFPEKDACYLLTESSGPVPRTASSFKKQFNCSIGFVPILGPVDHNEYLFKEEAARSALFNYTAARNFRNIWHHYPEKFGEFRSILKETWPGMDIEPPTVDYSEGKARLHMFCPEERIPREIFWAGFGFQVWCQMLTHLVQSSEKAIFLIDEPDIYLHADLQRQLLGLLRNLGPDILIATHSTEIITDAEADDIVLISKKRKSARRIRHPSELAEVFSILGSNLNPILTQLAKTRRAVFVEGKDFQVIGKFARKLRSAKVGNRTEFAVVPVEGFNPERIKNLKKGMEATLGGKIAAASILDRNYRCENECLEVKRRCSNFCDVAHVHACKEVENFLLVPSAIDRAATTKVADRAKRTGVSVTYEVCATELLKEFGDDKRNFVTSQCLAAGVRFAKSASPGVDSATINEATLAEFSARWEDPLLRLKMLPGKDALSFLNQQLQARYSISITPTSIIDAMKKDEVPEEMKDLITRLGEFAKIKPGMKKG